MCVSTSLIAPNNIKYVKCMYCNIHVSSLLSATVFASIQNLDFLPSFGVSNPCSQSRKPLRYAYDVSIILICRAALLLFFYLQFVLLQMQGLCLFVAVGSQLIKL